VVRLLISTSFLASTSRPRSPNGNTDHPVAQHRGLFRRGFLIAEPDRPRHGSRGAAGIGDTGREIQAATRPHQETRGEHAGGVSNCVVVFPLGKNAGAK